MNKPVAYYISELLYLHDCVIVPEFGGFVGNRKSAELNKTTGALTPPSKQILFNRNLTTNDGLLISHITQQEGITQEKAQQEVNKFVTESNNKLTTSKVLRITKIGLFTVGKENNIIFLQDSSENYNLEAFGMKPTYNKSIVRNTETQTQVEQTIQTLTTNKQNPKTLLRAAAVIIPLLALSYISITQQEKIYDIYTQMASLNPFDNKSNDLEKVEPLSTKKEAEVNIEVNPINKDRERKNITNIDEEPVIRQESYYIIAGAFAERKNANKMFNKLQSWNYDPTILEGSKLLRVSYNSFSNREEAVLALNQIKEDNPSAWLLTK